MNPNHHIPDELLVAYCAGEATEAAALVAATHLALCPLCRDRQELNDGLGGAMLEALEPAEMASGALDSVLAKLGERPNSIPLPSDKTPDSFVVLPEPLRSLAGGDVDTLSWKYKAPGVQEAVMQTTFEGLEARLIRLRKGMTIPKHTHQGQELTLVLTGSLSDDRGEYMRGDISAADESVTHVQKAGKQEDCISLVVNEGPLVPRSPWAWFLSKLVGI